MGNNEKAFPQTKDNNWYESGMDLRDYFAAKAMQAAMMNNHLNMLKGMDGCEPLLMAEDSYRMADAMLKEREK